MTEQGDLPDPAEETDDIPNPSSGVGLGADDEPDTFEPEEDPE